jgi:hypothetical protein
MPSDFEIVFGRLRAILEKHRGNLAVSADTPTHFGLAGSVGPATLEAWRGKRKHPTVPVAWVQIGKGYVSFHHMAVYGHPALLKGISKELKARMQGKSCFNFTTVDEALFNELEQLTVASCAAFRKAGFVQ